MLPNFLADSWEFFKQHYWALAFIILPLAIPTQIFMHLYGNDYSVEVPKPGQVFPPGEIFPFALLEIGVLCIWWIAATLYVASVISGKPLRISQIWQMTFRFLPRYLLLAIFLALVTIIGLLAFIVPGIIWVVRCSFAEFELLLNKRSILNATMDSWEKTRVYFLPLLGGLILINLILSIPNFLLAYLFGLNSEIYEQALSFWGPIDAVLRSFFIIFTYRVYDYATNSQELEQKAA